ncbi:MAG: hypothetical protein K2O18_13570, partial [Oscillospiraceae bacterium]|nr:hypothetical protein [Oscillospiraceae bacterium]
FEVTLNTGDYDVTVDSKNPTKVAKGDGAKFLVTVNDPALKVANTKQYKAKALGDNQYELTVTDTKVSTIDLVLAENTGSGDVYAFTATGSDVGKYSHNGTALLDKKVYPVADEMKLTVDLGTDEGLMPEIKLGRGDKSAVQIDIAPVSVCQDGDKKYTGSKWEVTISNLDNTVTLDFGTTEILKGGEDGGAFRALDSKGDYTTIAYATNAVTDGPTGNSTGTTTGGVEKNVLALYKISLPNTVEISKLPDEEKPVSSVSFDVLVPEGCTVELTTGKNQTNVDVGDPWTDRWTPDGYELVTIVVDVGAKVTPADPATSTPAKVNGADPIYVAVCYRGVEVDPGT